MSATTQLIPAWNKLCGLMKRSSNIIYYAAALVIMKGAAFITLPLLTKHLEPAQLGMLELLGTTSIFLCLVTGLAMHECLYRFIATIKNTETQFNRASQLYTFSLLVSCSLSLILLCVSSLLSYEFDMFSHHQRMLLFLAACYEAPMAICLAWLRLHDKATLFFKMVVIVTLVQVSVLLFAIVNGASITQLFAINTLSTLGQFLFLHGYIRFSFALPNLAQMRLYLAYASPVMLSAMVAFGLSGAERWLIALADNLETLGLYAIAAKFGLGLGILIQPFHMWWMPKRFAQLESRGQLHVVNITQYGLLTVCILAIVTHALGHVAVLALLDSNYHAAIDLIWLTLVIVLLKEWSEMLNLGLLYAKKTHQLFAINTLATAVAISLCFTTHDSGIYGVLFALIVGQLLRLLLIYIVSQKYIALPFSGLAMTCVLGSTLGMLYIGFYTQSMIYIVTLSLAQISALILLSAATNILPVSLGSLKSRLHQQKGSV
jgi:O-antigen/teichoic acid export membrane protein